MKENLMQLLKHIDACENRFFHFRTIEYDPDFYEEVRPAGLAVFQQLEEWLAEWTIYIREHQPRYVSLQQITQTKDAIEQITVESYHRKTSKAMFLKKIHSVQYTLKTMIDALEGEAHE